MKKQINRSYKQQAAEIAGYVMNIIPRSIRHKLIQAMLAPELVTTPRESVRWLLGIHDFTEWLINWQCSRWGDGIHIKHELMDGIHSFFYDHVPQNVSVLDVGCGIGAVAYSIAENVDTNVVGVDISEKNIEIAKQRFQHPRLRFLLGDVTKTLPVENVDVVVLSSILEHLEDRIELLQILQEKFSPTLFLIRVPTFERHHFAALKKELGLFPYTDPTHVLEYTPEIFHSEMKQAGLFVKELEIRWGDIWAVCVPQNI